MDSVDEILRSYGIGYSRDYGLTPTIKEAKSALLSLILERMPPGVIAPKDKKTSGNRTMEAMFYNQALENVRESLRELFK